MAVRQVDSTGHVVCFVHGKHVSRAAAHEHHEAPRAAAGSDDIANLVWLCATCHQLSHRVAQLRMLGRGPEADSVAGDAFQGALRTRFDQVVYEIVVAHSHAEAAGIGKEFAEIILELDHGVYNHLKALASEYRDQGRKVGVAKYIVSVLTKHVMERGYRTGGRDKADVKIDPRLR